MAKCEICGAFFVPRTANQVSCGDPKCGDPKCRAEKKRRRRVKREGRKLLPMDPMSGGFPMITFNAPAAQEVAA